MEKILKFSKELGPGKKAFIPAYRVRICAFLAQYRIPMWVQIAYFIYGDSPWQRKRGNYLLKCTFENELFFRIVAT